MAARGQCNGSPRPCYQLALCYKQDNAGHSITPALHSLTFRLMWRKSYGRSYNCIYRTCWLILADGVKHALSVGSLGFFWTVCSRWTHIICLLGASNLPKNMLPTTYSPLHVPKSTLHLHTTLKCSLQEISVELNWTKMYQWRLLRWLPSIKIIE
jgi:hypothetical protein